MKLHPKSMNFCSDCGQPLIIGQSKQIEKIWHCKECADLYISTSLSAPKNKELHPNTIDWNEGAKKAVEYLNKEVTEQTLVSDNKTPETPVYDPYIKKWRNLRSTDLMK